MEPRGREPIKGQSVQRDRPGNEDFRNYAPEKVGGEVGLIFDCRVTQGERRPPENNSGKVELLQSGVVEGGAGSPR